MSKKSDAVVGIYESHQAAVDALKLLQKNHFPMGHVGLIGKGEAVQDIDGVHTWDEATQKGSLIGGALGLLTGVTLVAVPGLGVVYLGGSVLAHLLGAASGMMLGGLGGTIVGAITGARYGVDGKVAGHEDYYHDAEKYKKEIEAGKFLIVVHGAKEEVTKAHDILTNHTEYETMGTHFLGT